MKITLVLHNIRSTYNVGGILRTAEGVGVESVVFSGYTPRYDDANLLPHLRAKLNHQIAKSALGAEKLVPQRTLEVKPPPSAQNSGQNLLTNYLKCATTEGYAIVGLENHLSPAEISKQVILGQKVTSSGKNIDFGGKIILILGEEVSGIPPEIRKNVNYFLEIPMQGQKESFNVSVAAAIALWALQELY